MKLYLVGGIVRDAIIQNVDLNVGLKRICCQIKTKDVDFAVETDSYESMRFELIKQNYSILYENPRYQTIKTKNLRTGTYNDFVLCRKDGIYDDGRRPNQTYVGTILDDLARRDFTMNAIAISEDGVIIDPYNGINDIKNRIIKCVGSTNRLKEDSLRLLRALRFQITLGFEIDSSIQNCLNDANFISGLKNISRERITEEINKCFLYNTLTTVQVFNKFSNLQTYLFNFHILKLKAF